MERLRIISDHLTASVRPVNPDDDIVLVAPVRTANGKASKKRPGQFAEVSPVQLLVPCLEAVIERSGIDPALIEDVVIGKVNGHSGKGAVDARIASLLAGIPKESSATTVNRQCSSGLWAISVAAGQIRQGTYDVAIAGGVESMSLDAGSQAAFAEPHGLSQEALMHPLASACYTPMGTTSENVAEKFGISREKQDYYGFLSQQRALAAQTSGRFKDEIVPVNGIDTDEGIRPGTTLEGLAKLRPAFGGHSTGGNSSQTSDGASAVLVTTRRKARELGLKPMAKFVAFSVVGVDPAIMGIGPAVAIPAVLKKAGLTINDIDLFEINEAFASQYAYTVESLGLDIDKVNVNGGAIALGHPLGQSGARMTATLLHELQKRSQRYGVVSMCIGTGMGAAAVFERI